MAFRDSINDLMFRFYERFKQNNNRLPVSVDADINVGDVQIGTVKQGGVDEGAEPWKVKAEELEQKIDALKQSIESGVQLQGRRVQRIEPFGPYETYQIRDTNDHISPTIDLSKFSKFDVLVNNSLNAELKIRLVDSSLRSDGRIVRNIRYSRTGLYDGSTYSDWVIIPRLSGNYVYPLSEAYPFLNSIVIEKMELWMRCDEAPTSGAVSVVVLGVPI